MFERIPVQGVTSQSGTFGCATSEYSDGSQCCNADCTQRCPASSDDDDTEEINMYATVTPTRTGSRVCRIQVYAEDVVPRFRLQVAFSAASGDIRNAASPAVIYRHSSSTELPWREKTSQSPDTTFDYSVDNGYSRNNPFSFRQVWHK